MLRRCTKLDDIEDLIEDLCKKAEHLLAGAEGMADVIAEEQRQEALKASLKRAANDPLTFPTRPLLRRNHSWKGRRRGLLTASELEDYERAMKDFEAPEGRPTSQRRPRRKALRPIHHEWDRENWRVVVDESAPDTQSLQQEVEPEQEEALVPVGLDMAS